MINNQLAKYLKDTCAVVLWNMLATSQKYVFQGTFLNGASEFYKMGACRPNIITET